MNENPLSGGYATTLGFVLSLMDSLYLWIPFICIGFIAVWDTFPNDQEATAFLILSLFAGPLATLGLGKTVKWIFEGFSKGPTPPEEATPSEQPTPKGQLRE